MREFNSEWDGSMKINLALGGGGSKGIAHIGVLRCLERNGIEVAAIAGTSAGGIVAALFAVGMTSEEILERYRQLDFSQMYRRDPNDRPSLLGTVGVRRAVEGILGERQFKDLPIPVALVSVDLRSGKEVVIKEGSVMDAVMATIALPGILPPIETEDYFLVDGGVLDPVPVAPARELAPQFPVVAVVLGSPPSQPREIFEPPKILQQVPLVNRFARLRLAQALNIFLHSIEVAGNYTTELRLQIDKPEVILRPDVTHIGLFERVDLDEVVQLGEQAACVALPEMVQATRWQNRLRRQVACWWQRRFAP